MITAKTSFKPGDKVAVNLGHPDAQQMVSPMFKALKAMRKTGGGFFEFAGVVDGAALLRSWGGYARNSKGVLAPLSILTGASLRHVVATMDYIAATLEARGSRWSLVADAIAESVLEDVYEELERSGFDDFQRRNEDVAEEVHQEDPSLIPDVSTILQ